MPSESTVDASAEMVAGYLQTATLADRRRDQVLAAGDVQEAGAWGRIGEYCREMAAARAQDDDRFRFQRDKERKRREVLMATEEVEALGLGALVDPDARPLPAWQLAALELALGYLSPMQRVCYEMVVGGRLTSQEVAAALKIDPREVRQHVARAKRRIAQTVYPRIGSIFDR